MRIFKCILESCYYILNIFHSLLGLFIIAVGLYILIAKWDSVSYTGYLFSSGIIVTLFGIAIFSISVIGHIAYINRYRHFGKSIWNGARIVYFYQFLIVLQFGYKAYCLIYLQTQYFVPLKSVSSSLDSNTESSSPSFSYVESYIASKFNNIFFSASRSLEYFPFWMWVNSNCPMNVRQNSCQACFTYSITACQADQLTCLSQTPNNQICPYTICRKGFVDYVENTIYLPFMITLLALMLIDIITFSLYLQVCCWSEKKRRVKVNSVSAVPNIEMSRTDHRLLNETRIENKASYSAVPKINRPAGELQAYNNNNHQGNKESEVRHQHQETESYEKLLRSRSNDKPQVVTSVSQELLF